MKKSITQNERLQLLGLLTLARQHAQMIHATEDAMDKIMDNEDPFGSHLNDAVYDTASIDEVLKNMKVKVTK